MSALYNDGIKPLAREPQRRAGALASQRAEVVPRFSARDRLPIRARADNGRGAPSPKAADLP